MNTSQFMDKQIMDLSNSQSNDNFVNFMNLDGDHVGSDKKEEIVPSYDFQLIRPIGTSQQSNLDLGDGGGPSGARVWNSADSKTNTTGIGIRNYSSLDSIEPSKAVLQKDDNAALLSVIDQTVKKHTENILHALEGVSARISELENRTYHLENSMDDLKVSVGNNHGSADGKLRQLENILGEVQAGVQVIKDKQGIIAGRLHHARLLVSRVGQQSETQNAVQSDSIQLAASAPQQSHRELPPPVIVQPSSSLSIPNAPPPIAQPPSTLPPPNVLPPASQQNLHPSVQLPNQLLLNQIPSVPQREPYFPSPSQIQEVTNLQYWLPPQQLQPPVPAAPQQQYQPPPPPHPPYSQPPPPPHQHPSLLAVNPSQPQPLLGHNPDETPYSPPQNYPPSLRRPPHPPNGNASSQQFYGSAPQMYEPPSVRPNSAHSTAYEPYPYSGAPSQYGSGSLKRLLSSAAAQGGGSGYPQFSTARILPHALRTASGVGSRSGSARTGNKVPIDDVVDRVTNMGFPRDQVRATVRKLTENGQSVDLNVVLDKLMNNG